MDNKRMFLAALLSMGVLLLWQQIFPAAPVAPPPAPVEVGAAEPAVEGPGAQPAPVSPAPTQGAVGTALQDQPVELVAAENERELVLETDDFRAVFGNRGAQLLSFVSKRHANGNGGGVDLVKRRSAPPYPFAILDANGASDPLNEALFVGREGTDELEFEYSGPLGQASKTFWIRPDGILGVRVKVAGRTGWSLLFGPGVRNPGTEEFESRFSRRSVVYSNSEGVEREAAQKIEGTERISGSDLYWVGLEDTYFFSSWLVIEQPIAAALVQPVAGRIVGEDGDGVFERVPPGAPVEADEVVTELALMIVSGDEELEGAAYLGAKQYNTLAALPHDLQDAVNLGFFAVLAKPILFGLRWLYENWTGNWGWSIILMTLVIRIILFPLTHKSFVSMQKMQEVNPKIQAIRNRYRGKLKDKQGRPNTEMQRKMNEEVMGLYKKEGVNPAGGCLPMLLQIPVLFAFYNLLSAAVELRHAPWIFWIQDLSAPDPYYALPIIMGASQFVQQKLTPTAADPMQRRMFMLMPFFFTILFLGFPSGMVLYWLTNNVLGIAQQAGYKSWKERASQAKVPAKSRREKK